MKTFKVSISWQTRCRGYLTEYVEAETEDEARSIIEDEGVKIDLNQYTRSDMEWDVDTIKEATK